jgi:hypothetical protein
MSSERDTDPHGVDMAGVALFVAIVVLVLSVLARMGG